SAAGCTAATSSRSAGARGGAIGSSSSRACRSSVRRCVPYFAPCSGIGIGASRPTSREGRLMRTALRVLALGFALRAVGNLLKRFGAGSGLVVFGHLLSRETPLAPLLGVAMLVYAYGLWREAGWALPLGVAYALFATANLLLFPVYTGLPPGIA